MSEVAVYAPQQQIVTSAFSALAYMTDEQLEVQIGLLRRAQDVAARVKKSLMVQDVHYGVIPGTNKPSLLKPGAEVLLQAFQLVATFEVDFRDGDGKTSPDVRAIVTCEVRVGDKAGPVVAEGVGEANSWEKKHRRRRAQPTCPDCGMASIGRSKAEYGGGYFCNKKAGGCGNSFKPNSKGAEIIASTDAGEIDNPDPHDLANTILKMAKKRALLDATLTATASSDLFTQDMDEHAAAAPSGPRAVTPEMRAQAVLTAVADMSEAHKVRAKQLAASLGAERFTVRSLLTATDALAAVEDWITNGAELPVAVVPDAVQTQPDGIYEPVAEPTVSEPAEQVWTMRDAFPSAFDADGSRPASGYGDHSDEPFLLGVDAVVPAPLRRRLLGAP